MARVLLLAGAAALLWAAPAGAFERPKKEPDAKAQACPEVGAGYIRVPGSTTCISVGGLVRVEAATIKGGR